MHLLNLRNEERHLPKTIDQFFQKLRLLSDRKSVLHGLRTMFLEVMKKIPRYLILSTQGRLWLPAFCVTARYQVALVSVNHVITNVINNLTTCCVPRLNPRVRSPR